MDAVAYIRVSTEGQAQNGISLDAQRARIETWCKANDHRLAGVHIDAGISGAKADNRPALQTALVEACRSKAILVVYSLSRLARSTKDAIVISERLAKSGAELVSLTEQLDTTSAAGKLFFRLMISLSEFERELVAERTRCAMEHLRIQGKRISGRIPFGYDLSAGGLLKPNHAEQRTIQMMKQLRNRGYSLSAVARKLTAKRIPAKLHGTWTAETVKGVLRRASSRAPAHRAFSQ